MRGRLRWAATLLVLVPAASGAAVMERYDLARLVDTAELVITGHVTATESYRDDGRIFTRVTVAPVLRIKGRAGEAVVIKVAGGVVGGIGQRVSGAARFDVGEDVVVFLAHRGGPSFRVVGMAQGKLTIEPRPSGPVVKCDLSAVRTVARDREGALHPVSPALPTEQPLGALVRALAARVADPR